MNKKRIIIAVTGSIAAYKAVFLLRLFKKAGAEVKVLMTPSATDFVKPLTFSVLSEMTVDHDISDSGQWNNHVESGLWADALIIAPCTANTLAKMAHGLADNIVLATYLSARCPVFVSPAMDLDMYHHPTTKSNLALLNKHGVNIIPAEYGQLASGLVGDGRMAEPETIYQFVAAALSKKQDLVNKSILITAGPTQEAIDPVRYIGNRSSGKMGIALANECARRGAHVKLVLGPTHLGSEDDNVEVIRVGSAAEMLDACQTSFGSCDIAIMAAAVADYRPAQAADKKLKKSENDPLTLDLVETIDIAKTLGAQKRDDQLLIGFALETNDELKYAGNKLKKKNFDFIVLNSLRDAGAGFAVDTNKVTIIHKDLTIKDFGLKLKTEVATDIVDQLVELLK